ncbi:MAG: M91 family zinc metallopeptidase [Burkholderiaceae bacterium]
MITHHYNRNIRIVGGSGDTLQKAIVIPSVKAQTAFIDLVSELLEQLQQLMTGAELIAAIANTGKSVTIFLDGNGKGSCAQMNPENTNSFANRLVKSFRPPSKGSYAEKFVEKPQTGTWMSATPRRRDDATQDEKLKFYRYYTQELSRVIDRSPLSRDMVGRLIGMTGQDVKDMEWGRKVIDDPTYYKLSYVLYEWLTPGPGIHTQIRFDASVNPQHEGAKPQLNWEVAPLHIALGHELIHAWRMMAGRRLVPITGWEEEAMTVGLPPFASMRLTENLLRVQSGAAVRFKYGSPAVANADFMDKYKQLSEVATAGKKGRFHLPKVFQGKF